MMYFSFLPCNLNKTPPSINLFYFLIIYWRQYSFVYVTTKMFPSLNDEDSNYSLTEILGDLIGDGCIK